MKRLDLLFAAALGILASFVAVEAYGMRGGAGTRHVVGAAGANARVSEPEDGETRSARRGATEAGAARGRGGRGGRGERGEAGERRARHVAEIRTRLELSAAGTYIGEVLAAHDSALARWPDRRGDPLRVWIQPIARIQDWSPASVSIVREAFLEWTETGIPLSFTFVLDSASANVRVTWIDRFNESISGKTLWTHDDYWTIMEAGIVLAVHHRTGEALDASATRAIALHEVGHLIGLDHTTDTTSIMTPRVRVKALSAVDRATAQLLYQLPSGPIGNGQAGARSVRR
jgi:Matrixin